MNQQLELSLVENIRRTFNEAKALSFQAAEMGRDAVLKARECGQYLIEARQTVPHGQWLEWLSKSCYGCNLDRETARRWVKLAETPIEKLEEALSLRQAYIAAGILPEPVREPGQQQGRPEGQRWLTGISKAWEIIGHTLEKKTLDKWPETDRQTLKAKLKPMVELYEKL
jgi:hypothetical protein